MDWLDIKEFIKDTLKYILLIIFILFFIVYIATLSQVVGNSMSPNYNDGDIVLIDKITPNFSKYKRGDIISFKYADTKYLIKRIVGLPGEKIEIGNNKIIIDGKVLSEYYLEDVINSDFNLESLGYKTIPDNYYFVLGDNREDSLDSRDSRVGLVSSKDIIGKARIRVWPINKLSVIK